MFWRRTFWWIFLGVVVLALLGIGGTMLYQAGFAHGAMAEWTPPAGSEGYAYPYGMMPYHRYFGPRVGFFGFFPLLFCFGGFFLLMLMFGFGRRRYWMHRGKDYWKHHGPHPYWHGGPWGSGKPPWADDQPEGESDAPNPGTDSSVG